MTLFFKFTDLFFTELVFCQFSDLNQVMEVQS